MAKGSSTGIILSVVDYKDADCLVEIYSRNLGKHLFLAKGARRPKSKKRGSLEIFNEVSYSWSKTKGLPLILEVVVETPFPNIKKHLNKMSLAFYFCEIVKKVTREEDSHPDLYQILLKYLVAVEQSGRLKILRQSFLRETLITLGYLTEKNHFASYDAEIEAITERRINSFRVGKAMLSP